MNFCGWSTVPNCQTTVPQYQQPYAQFQPPMNFIPYSSPQKISVKNSEVSKGTPPVPIRFCQSPPISCEYLNQTQPSSAMSSQCGQHSLMYSTTNFTSPKRKNSIIDSINEDNYKNDMKESTSRPITNRQPILYRSAHEKQRLRSEQPFLRSQFCSYNEQGTRNSFAQLLKQNHELKKIINEQYIPLKSMYARLKQEQQDRQFLVSQLEWKVRELAREIKNKRP